MTEFHDLANVFPLLSDDEIEALAADIQTNGLHHSITLYQDKILDGRNRYLACELAEVEPSYTEYTGGDPVAFVISENISRRHLDESQRAMCAARLANMGEGRPDKTRSIDLVSQSQSANMLNVSVPSVKRAVQVITHGVPELVAAVDRGEIAVSAASQVARLPKETQVDIVSGNGHKPHVSHNSGNNEWYTPHEYIEAARFVLGEIDLDPASSILANEVIRAKRFYSIKDDGLQHEWCGRVWMNPPYSSELIGKFTEKFAYHVQNGDISSGIVLVNNATDTEWFGNLISVSSAFVFTRGRVRFLRETGEIGAPLQGQALIYSGKAPAKFLKEFRCFGWGTYYVTKS